jgi:hypothetical protein
MSKQEAKALAKVEAATRKVESLEAGLAEVNRQIQDLKDLQAKLANL